MGHRDGRVEQASIPKPDTKKMNMNSLLYWEEAYTLMG